MRQAENFRRGDQPSVCRVLVDGDSITGHCLANSHKKILVGPFLICCADVHSVDVSDADGVSSVIGHGVRALGYLYVVSAFELLNVLPFPFRCSDDNPSASPRSVSLRDALWIGIGGWHIIFLLVILRGGASWTVELHFHFRPVCTSA